MLKARGVSAAGSIALVAAASAAGGVLGGAVALRCCSVNGGVGLSPRRAVTLIIATITVIVVVLAALAWPTAAHASTLGTVKGVGCGVAGILGSLGGKLGGTATGLVCGGSGGGGVADVLSGLLHALPKLLPALLGGVLGWFVGSAAISHLLPGVLHLLVYSPVVLVGDGSQASRFVSGVVLPVSEGALTSTVVMAAVWYWLVGIYSLDSGAEALTALSRAGAAVFAVPVWLWGVPQLISAVNLLTRGLVSQSGDAGSLLGALLGVSAGAGAAGFLEKDLTRMKGLGVGILVIGLALVIFLLLLMALKVVVAAATVLLFIAFPLVLTLFPLRRLEWLTEGVLQAFVVVLLIPVGWALILATMGVVASTIGVSVHGGTVHVSAVGGWAGSLLAPMVALVLLWMLVALPRQLIHLALLQTVSRRGFAGDVVHRTAVRVSSDVVRGYLPERLGGFERLALPAHETVLAGVGMDGSRAAGEQRARQALSALDDPPSARTRTADGASATGRVADSRGPDAIVVDAAGGGGGDSPRASASNRAGASAAGGPRGDVVTPRRGASGSGGRSPSGSRGAVRDMDGFAIARVQTTALERGIRQAQLTRQVNPPSREQVAQGVAGLPEGTRQAVRQAHGRADDGAFTAQMVRQSLSSEHPRAQREVFSMLAAAGPDERDGGIAAALRRLEQGEPGDGRATSRPGSAESGGGRGDA